MRRFVLALAMIHANCDWPPWPGSIQGAGVSGLCGTDWTTIITDAQQVAALNSVFITDAAVYAVGENGQIVVMKNGTPLAICALENKDYLTSISVLGTRVLMSGLSGIYETSTAGLCATSIQPLSKSYKISDCYDTVICGDVSIVACSKNIVYKSTSNQPWNLHPSTVSFRGSVCNNTEAFVGADNKSVYRASLSDLSNWTQVTDPGLLIIRDGWYDGNNNALYVVGNVGLFSVYQSMNWNHKRSLLDAGVQNADIASIWGNANLNTRFFSAKGSSNYFCTDVNGSIGCSNQSDIDFRGIHGNQQAVFRVGSHMNLLGVIDCKRL